MKRVLEMNRSYNRCRSMFNDGDVDITFNEALLLEVIYDRPLMMKEIQDELVKDRSYIFRVMKKLEEAGYIAKRERVYALTSLGRTEVKRNRLIFDEIERDVTGGKECCKSLIEGACG